MEMHPGRKPDTSANRTGKWNPPKQSPPPAPPTGSVVLPPFRSGKRRVANRADSFGKTGPTRASSMKKGGSCQRILSVLSASTAQRTPAM